MVHCMERAGQLQKVLTPSLSQEAPGMTHRDSAARVCGRETEYKGLLPQSKALAGKPCCLSKMYLLNIKIKQLVMQSLFEQTPRAQIFKRVLLFVFPLSSGLFA